jgi:hypothetical protein
MRCLCGIACLALLAGAAAMSEEGAAAEEFRFFTRFIRIPERGDVPAQVLMLGTNMFTFMPRPDWVVRYKADARSIVMVSKDQAASLTVRFVRDVNPDRELEAAVLQGRLQKAFPEARIVEEFVCYCAGKRGLAFDLERVGANKTKVGTRCAFVRLAGEMIEFDLTTAASRFGDYVPAIRGVMNSFSVESVDQGKSGDASQRR